jgi:hypothetical protein
MPAALIDMPGYPLPACHESENWPPPKTTSGAKILAVRLALAVNGPELQTLDSCRKKFAELAGCIFDPRALPMGCSLATERTDTGDGVGFGQLFFSPPGKTRFREQCY